MSQELFNDLIKINDLQLEAVIGFHHWERNEPQPLIINIELGTNFDRAFLSDNLEHTIDYASVSKEIKKLCQNSKFHLMEKLAGTIIQHIFKKWPVQNIKISIRKPHALRNAITEIVCYRTKEQI